MNRKEIIITEINNSVFGDPWHGSPINKILTDITEEQAFNRPITNAHSIAELVLHIWAWTDEVMNRLNGNQPGDPAQGDWPEEDAYKSRGWEEVKNMFFTASEKIIETIKNLPNEKFDQKVGISRNAPLGTGISCEEMIHGLAQHNAYHGGQIALLKKYFI